jgi:RNA polymerase sigma-70 factor (ECF subfamily)
VSSTRASLPLSSASEATVVGLAMTGDDDAFSELVRRRQGSIRGLLRGMTGSASTADDLAQDAFVQAWRKIRSLRTPAAFSGWLRQIAVNVFLQHIRRADAPTDQATLDEERAAGAARDTDLEIDLQRVLAELRPIERLCIVLSYQEGLSHSEIVEATGLPSGTVKSHISRGSARLRESLATETTS